MRLKTFNASTMSDAMRLVREHLGEEAIIVSTQRGEGGQGVRVTAALEGYEAEVDGAAAPGKGRNSDGRPGQRPARREDTIEVLSDALDRHGVPANLAERLLRAATTLGVDDPILALAGALDGTFSFHPLPDGRQRQPIMLIGPPGVGKTLTVAKLAARAVMRKREVNLITTDLERAGGYEQLEVFARVLKIDVMTAESPQRLQDALAACGRNGVTIIDTAGRNPYLEDEMRALAKLVEAAKAETALVLAAGGDPLEAADIARAFAAVGAKSLVATRIDLARRLASLLVAVDGSRLKFADVSITASVAEGLKALNPVSLARLLLPDLSAEEEQVYRNRAAS
ncbi:MAG: ATP-binding protein [Proteobacteria bacterium]|nr:ATP-binding protein [Pseudomonadota bacterium]MBI3498768.1 ATP-binding protein [Pseudomonadota bacterium]